MFLSYHPQMPQPQGPRPGALVQRSWGGSRGVILRERQEDKTTEHQKEEQD